jgi:hypothetical protein
MIKKYFLIIGMLLLVSTMSALVVKQNDAVDLVHPVRIDDFPNSAIDCNISIFDPSNVEVVDYAEMTNDYEKHNYTFDNASQLGTYTYDITCSTGASNKTESFDFEVTSTGKSQVSVWQNSILIIFVVLAMFLFALGFYLDFPVLGFFSFLLVLFGGIHTMIYGLSNVANFYTRGIAGILVGFGIIFMLISVYDWMLKDFD